MQTQAGSAVLTGNPRDMQKPELVKQPLTEVAVRNLHNAVISVNESVHLLLERLAPVLSDDHPNKGKETCPPEPHYPPLADEIRSQANVLDSLNEAVNSALVRLEI